MDIFIFWNLFIAGIKTESEEGMYILRHSCAHLLAQAVSELYPNAKPTIGPPVENGFYYDFAMENIGEDDFRTIEKKMEELCRKNLKVERIECTQEKLKELYQDNPYKLEIINERIVFY